MNKTVPIHDVLCACRVCHTQDRSATDALQEVIDRVNVLSQEDNYGDNPR